MWKEGAWVGDSHCGLSIKGTYSCIYVSHEFLIHPWPSLFLQRGTLCLSSQSLFLCYKLVPLLFLI